MKNVSILVLLLLVSVSLGACANKKNNSYLPSYAITEPGKAISVPHPVEAQKRNISEITIWRGIMNPDLLVEVIAGNGVFPVIGIVGDKEFRGFAYLIDLNYWGDWIIQYEFPNSFEEIKLAKFVLISRDGGFAYSLTGERIVAKEGEQKQSPYDPEKFDDQENRKEFVKNFGLTLTEIDDNWRHFFRVKGIQFNKSFIKTYTVGSDEWNKMVDDVNKNISAGNLKAYKINGEIRIGQMSFESFADKASDVPDYTTGDRFIKRASLPLISLASIAFGPIVATGMDLVGTVYSSNVDNNWHNHTLRSKFWGYELAPTFRWVCDKYGKLLLARDAEIKELKKNKKED